jgi:predicted dehydrogenase
MKTAALEELNGASVRPARKPRLGFLGVGWIGLQRMMSLQKADAAEIVAVADSSAELAEKAAEAAPGAARFQSLEELLALDLDGIAIATPSALHAEQAIAALRRGTAVFCQKPLARDAAETEAVMAEARAADRLLGVDLSYRYTQALGAVRRLAQSGELGDIFAAELVFHNAYGPQKPWFYDPQLAGGGCVIDLGIHLVDAALWVLRSEVAEVRSRLFHQGRRIEGRGAVCEDYATAQLETAGGAVVELACSWHLHAGQDAVIRAAFYGTRGAAVMENVNGSFVDFTAYHCLGTSRERLCAPPDDWGGGAAMAWARRLAQSGGYDPAAEEILEVARVLDRIYEGAGA